MQVCERWVRLSYVLRIGSRAMEDVQESRRPAGPCLLFSPSCHFVATRQCRSRLTSFFSALPEPCHCHSAKSPRGIVNGVHAPLCRHLLLFLASAPLPKLAPWCS